MKSSVRNKTDASLANERTKTDTSLVQEQNKAEEKASQLVEASRTQADSDQALERKERDATQQEVRSSPANSGIQFERQSADVNLELERKRTDEAQRRERAETDAAVVKERRRLRLTAEALLSLERRATDTDLQGERTQVDDKVKHADASLQNEVSAHDQTKAMMAIVSHDLRNPLSSIAMAGELLQVALAKEEIVSEDILQFLGMIRRNAAAMDRLITDLLDVERMSAGKVTMQSTAEPVSGLFEECSDIFGILAAQKSIQFTTEVVGGDLVAHMDRDRILQVLSNLVGNALKHTAKGGTISLKAISDHAQIKISVADTGEGIPLSEQARIFDKFSQLGKSDRRGLGLGLHVSKWIVEAHGGILSVQSEPGKGSVFAFSVPKG